jgi:hypothetical protein
MRATHLEPALLIREVAEYDHEQDRAKQGDDLCHGAGWVTHAACTLQLARRRRRRRRRAYIEDRVREEHPLLMCRQVLSSGGRRRRRRLREHPAGSRSQSGLLRAAHARSRSSRVWTRRRRGTRSSPRAAPQRASGTTESGPATVACVCVTQHTNKHTFPHATPTKVLKQTARTNLRGCAPLSNRPRSAASERRRVRTTYRRPTFCSSSRVRYQATALDDEARLTIGGDMRTAPPTDLRRRVSRPRALA